MVLQRVYADVATSTIHGVARIRFVVAHTRGIDPPIFPTALLCAGAALAGVQWQSSRASTLRLVVADADSFLVGVILRDEGVELTRYDARGGPLAREVLAFPAGRNDDQVDSMTQALIWMKDDSSRGGGFVGKFY